MSCLLISKQTTFTTETVGVVGFALPAQACGGSSQTQKEARTLERRAGISGRCQLLVSHTDGSDLTLVHSVRAHMYFPCAHV